MEETKIDFKKIESKWQKKCEDKKIFEVKENSKKPKYYVLEMFPYPSGSGLHMGHALNYTIGDILTRFKRMNNFNVLYPMGYDALGLPAENAAIQAKTHPKKYTEQSVANYIKQQKELGLSYDWSRMVNTADPEYYKWDQWIFLQMFKKEIAFRKKAPVNWCPKCETVLANEQVHDGKCWRHEDTNVELKHLEQWFFKITKYADELYEKIETLKGWPDRTKAMQKNWIGKSHGTEINFKINNETWPIFTTRPDTIYGVTFMVISAQHPCLMELVTDEQKNEVNKFLKKIKSVSAKDFGEEWMQKEGAFTGSYAINPINDEKIPIYTGNFVLAEYGCGMVMAVPAHDQRDFEFAKKYKIPIKVVIQPDQYELNPNKMSRAFTSDGTLVNSKEFNNQKNREAIDEITKYLAKNKQGKKTIQFKLKDWLLSRQRYWGTPIPIVYCNKCGIVPVDEKDLPIKLPEKVKFGKGNPLETAKDWIKTKCPKCGGEARRETDTMDTFVNSSWYFLRYCDSKNNKAIFDKSKAKYWCPIDQYIGGSEHACMHLIYFRFYTKFLRDIGLINFDEPAINLFHQGLLSGEGGEKMSKSKGNVILPEVISKKYGIDTARFFLMSLASPDKPRDWSEKGIQGSFRFTKKIMEFFSSVKPEKISSKKIQSKINKAIKEVTQDIETFKYNLATIKLRSLFDAISEEEVSKKDLETFLILLHPFCPHITEELWEKIGNKPFISLTSWPKADEKKIDESLEKQEQAIEKLSDDINHVLKLVKSKPKKAYIYVLPQEKQNYQEAIEIIKKKTKLEIQISAVNDKDKHDPENKAKKTKPGKPAIYLE